MTRSHSPEVGLTELWTSAPRTAHFFTAFIRPRDQLADVVERLA